MDYFGLPETVWEMCLDFTLTSVLTDTGIGAGADVNLGAAVKAEGRKRDLYDDDATRLH